VDKDLHVVEVFVSLISPADTTGQTLADSVKEVLCHLELPINNLRAQTYDGAANMAGTMNGCQAIISREFPLALHFHCAAHCANLAAEHTVEACALIRDSLGNVRELGVLYKRSGKFKHMFDDIASNVYESPSTLKPLCPTRWLCRVTSVNAVLNQYEAVLSSLEEMSSKANGETSTKAAGLLDQFRKGATVLALKICNHVFGPLEEFNKSLQSSSGTVSGMMESAKIVKNILI
jgi:hypothetical protein